MVSKEERLNTIIRHIKRVEDNCNLLARKLMEEDFEFAVKLIQLGRIHDASKFNAFEFNYLGNFENKKPVEFTEALKMHHTKNPHHPEFWTSGIRAMSDVYIAEMVCDCLARGQEFGTDTRKWFREEATKKYGFTMEDREGKLIEKYLNLLLTEPFKKD
jgi:hypothetical protein